MGAIERIYQIIDYKQITVNWFSNKVGVSNGYFAKQRSSNASIGSQILEKIVNFYPEISAEWLLTGEGEMLKSSQAQKSYKVKDNKPLDNTVASLLSEIKELKMENKLLNREIGCLEGKVESLKQELDLKKDFQVQDVQAKACCNLGGDGEIRAYNSIPYKDDILRLEEFEKK